MVKFAALVSLLHANIIMRNFNDKREEYKVHGHVVGTY